MRITARQPLAALTIAAFASLGLAACSMSETPAEPETSAPSEAPMADPAFNDLVGPGCEAYAEQVEPRLLAIAEEARTRWPVGRLALLHRTGELGLGESSVVVVASSPHRGEAFDAARFCIDTLKATVPIWKRETWEGGEDWGLCAHDVVEVSDLS